MSDANVKHSTVVQ